MQRGPRKHYSFNFLNPDFALAASSCCGMFFSLLLKLNKTSFKFNVKESSSEHIACLENLLKKQIMLLRLKWCPSPTPYTFKTGVTAITSQPFLEKNAHFLDKNTPLFQCIL